MRFRTLNRRHVLAGGAALACLVKLARPAHATPEAMAAAIKEATGAAAVRDGRVKIDIPPIAENGNAVPLTGTVESPMTAGNHVKSIFVFSERNPAPDVVRFHLGPRAGKPVVSTRIRLASTQTIVAIAALSDGTFWRDQAKILVTLGACVEGE